MFGKLFSELVSRSRSDSARATSIGILVFFATYFVSNFYINGDQTGYQNGYLAIRGLGPLEGFERYTDFISTTEVVHYFISYLASNLLIDKNLFFAIVNAILAVCAARLMQKWGVRLIIIVCILITNYYILVLYFAAERLKIGIIFAIIYCMYPSLKYATILLFSSILSHYTLILLYVGSFFEKIESIFSDKNENRRKSIIEISIYSICTIVIFILFRDYIFWKFQQYASKADVSFRNMLPLAVYLALSIFYAREHKKPILDFMPLFVAFLFLGGSRINMLGYFIFLSYGLKMNGGLNFGVLLSSGYFAYKSSVFLQKVFYTGQGF